MLGQLPLFWLFSPGCSSHHFLINSISKNREFSEMLALLISPVCHDMKQTDPSLKSHSMAGSIGTENMMQCEPLYLGTSIKRVTMGMDLHLQLSSTKQH